MTVPDSMLVDVGPQNYGEEYFTFGEEGFDPYNRINNVSDVYDDEDFYENLAETLDEGYLDELAVDIIQKVDQDIEARKPWVERFKQGMEMAGLLDGDLDDGPFPGASSVAHTIVTEAIQTFWATSTAELFPSSGAVNIRPMGDFNEDNMDRADRVKEHMNFQLFYEDVGYYSETSRLMMAVAYQGTAIRKTFRDAVMDRTVSIHVPIEDFIVPYHAVDLETASRFTHRIWKTPNELRKEQVNGKYLDVELGKPVNDEEDEIYAVKEEMVDVQRTDDQDDARHELLECYIELDIPGYEDEDEDGETGIELPYIVTVERTSRRVLAVYRNWYEHDDLKRRRLYFTKYGYVPSTKTFYDFGILHILGGLQTAGSGALRALLDSAATASLQGGFVSSDANIQDKRIAVIPGEYQDIDLTAEELKNAFFNPPFKEPSPALFNLLGFLTDTGRRLASISDIAVGDQSSQNAPVGSTLALIEQGKRVFSTIHRGLHHSASKEFRLRFEINREFIPEEGYEWDVEGNPRTIMAADYGPGLEVIPVSDPNVFSSSQRMALAQAEYQLMKENPGKFDEIKVLKRVLKAMNSSDPDDILVGEDMPQPVDPGTEIQLLLHGKPIQVYPDQDHLSHLQVYFAFASNPQFGGNPVVGQMVMPRLTALGAQRLGYLWAQHAEALGVPVSYIDPKEGEPGIPNVPYPQLAKKMAEVAPQLAKVPGIPAPPDPNQQKMEAELKLEQAKGQQEMQQKDATFKQEMAHKQTLQQFEVQKKGIDHQQKSAQDAEKHFGKMAMERAENESRAQQLMREAVLTEEQEMRDMLIEQARQQMERDQEQYAALMDMIKSQTEFEHNKRMKDLEFFVAQRKGEQDVQLAKKKAQATPKPSPGGSK